MLSKTCVLREIHCSNYFGAVLSPFVQQQKELLTWKSICLQVKSISESPCNINYETTFLLLNSFLWNVENSYLGAWCLSLWQRSVRRALFVFFPQVCTSQLSYFMKYEQLLMLQMAKQSKIINLGYFMHCGLFFNLFFSFYDSVLLI